MRIPIRTRLTIIYCSVFCLSMMLIEIGAYAGLKYSIDAVTDLGLQARLTGVVGFLDEHIERRTPEKLRAEIATHAALEPAFLRIDRVGAGEIFRGHSISIFGSRKTATAEDKFWTDADAQNPMRIFAAKRHIKNKQYDLYLASDVSVPNAILQRFRWLFLLTSPVVFLCAAMAGYWISKRALQPVSRLTNAARLISATNLQERLAIPESGDELQDLAETLNEMLSRIESVFRHVTQFTANASHELRTPLALIRATSEVALLRVNGNADAYRDALHKILREAEKNSALLDDMLLLARADASSAALALKPLEFSGHIEQVCDRVLPLAQEKRVRVERRGIGANLWVMADASHLKRLWLILLDNAMKYTPEGGSISVSWHAVSEEMLMCEVRDTGIGIAAPDLPHIFERFFRADKARSREDGGAGLGLSLARWIVDAHRATIEVESTVGQGSVFRVLMPRVQIARAYAPESEAKDLLGRLTEK